MGGPGGPGLVQVTSFVVGFQKYGLSPEVEYGFQKQCSPNPVRSCSAFQIASAACHWHVQHNGSQGR